MQPEIAKLRKLQAYIHIKKTIYSRTMFLIIPRSQEHKKTNNRQQIKTLSKDESGATEESGRVYIVQKCMVCLESVLDHSECSSGRC